MIACTATVRLNESEKLFIAQAVDESSQALKYFWHKISLFGSRVKLDQKGGDIDLYIEIGNPTNVDLSSMKRDLVRRMHDKLGEQKIDIVLFDGTNKIGAFQNIILSSKVDLWIKKI